MGWDGAGMGLGWGWDRAGVGLGLAWSCTGLPSPARTRSRLGVPCAAVCAVSCVCHRARAMGVWCHAHNAQAVQFPASESGHSACSPQTEMAGRCVAHSKCSISVQTLRDFFIPGCYSSGWSTSVLLDVFLALVFLLALEMETSASCCLLTFWI